MTRTYRWWWLMALIAMSQAFAATTSKAPPDAPAEVAAAAPTGTRLLAFATSGDQPNADALAVFETAPDNDDVRHRTLVMFGKKNGKFVPDFSSDTLIACSRCSQFHDDQFYPEHVRVSPGQVHIEQFDGGDKPSQTILDFVRKNDGWHVTRASREIAIAGEGEMTAYKLPIPSSGLAKDMNAHWQVPVFLNLILINHKKGEKFSFEHGYPTVDAMWKSQGSDCNRQDCIILIQQGDGCISLVRDESSHPFAAGTPDPKNEKSALSKALDLCKSAGGQECKEVRTDCAEGIR